MEAVSGESSLKSWSRGLTVTVIYFPTTNTCWVKVLGQWHIFQAEMWGRVGRTGGRTDLFIHIYLLYFLPHTSCQRQLQLRVVWSCNVALSVISLYLVEWRTCVVIRRTPPRFAPPAYPFTLVWFANTVRLILPPEADQYRSKISPLTGSKTFTQRRRRRNGTGSPHSNGSVNGPLILLRYAMDRLNDHLLQFLHFVGWCLVQTFLHVLEEPCMWWHHLALTDCPHEVQHLHGGG